MLGAVVVVRVGACDGGTLTGGGWLAIGTGRRATVRDLYTTVRDLTAAVAAGLVAGLAGAVVGERVERRRLAGVSLSTWPG